MRAFSRLGTRPNRTAVEETEIVKIKFSKKFKSQSESLLKYCKIRSPKDPFRQFAIDVHKSTHNFFTLSM